MLFETIIPNYPYACEAVPALLETNFFFRVLTSLQIVLEFLIVFNILPGFKCLKNKGGGLSSRSLPLSEKLNVFKSSEKI